MTAVIIINPCPIVNLHHYDYLRHRIVSRFKGQAAPCVILTEIDFDEMDEITLRKLFVGATRATMKLVLVMTETSTKFLLNNSR